MFGNLLDYAVAMAHGIVAVLLWHRAEPRLRKARGPLRAWCIIFLGFVLAWSFPLALVRPMTDGGHWQLTMRDIALLLCALCFYHHAMTLGSLPGEKRHGR